MNWNKLTKEQLIHVITEMNSEKAVIASIEDTRKEQKRLESLTGSGRPTCWDCQAIARKLGID